MITEWFGQDGYQPWCLYGERITSGIKEVITRNKNRLNYGDSGNKNRRDIEVVCLEQKVLMGEEMYKYNIKVSRLFVN